VQQTSAAPAFKLTLVLLGQAVARIAITVDIDTELKP
jgi:hypothetical protein